MCPKGDYTVVRWLVIRKITFRKNQGFGLINQKGGQFMFCPKCKAEYMPGITKCADCGVDLVDELPREEETECRKKQTPGQNRYEEVFTTFSPAEVALIQSILDGAAIDYYFIGENFHTVQPLVEPVRLVVNKEQLEEVKKLLKDILK